MGYIRKREDSAIEITSSTSISIGPSGAILKFGGASVGLYHICERQPFSCVTP